VLAERIVADRERRGPFRHLEELMRVHGVGPRTVERIRAHAGCGSEEP
jgi:competence ComEA-like helix-hairpin-helix protein